MQLKDVIKQVDLTKRAIKYYEEEGLISITNGENRYRNYT